MTAGGPGTNKGMMSKLGQMFGIGQNSGTGGTGAQPDMLITAEGTQSINDFAWKKKENKYMGINSISEKESKDLKDLKTKAQIDQYISAVPDNGRYLGFENVSNLFNTIYSHKLFIL